RPPRSPTLSSASLLPPRRRLEVRSERIGNDVYRFFIGRHYRFMRGDTWFSYREYEQEQRGCGGDAASDLNERIRVAHPDAITTRRDDDALISDVGNDGRHFVTVDRDSPVFMRRHAHDEKCLAVAVDIDRGAVRSLL